MRVRKFLEELKRRRMFRALAGRTPDATPPPPAPREVERPVAPGAMTALLEELARAPDVHRGGRALKPGDLLGRYQVVREIGRGGFGVVCEANDRELGRLVAVKTIRARPGADMGMLRAEAEAAAQLQHPNIVTVHDVGTTEGDAWLVYELLRGETMEERLRRGVQPPEEALRIAEAVAAGLAHAHRAGVIHRDLKPANVFLCEDGGVKILDFGLSRFLGSSGRDGGTPGYMAPEQWRGEPQDGRADVFAAGVMLYEALYGARPYPVEDGRSSVLDARRAPALRRQGVPARLRQAVSAAIDPDPGRRPRDGAAWLEALRRARRGGTRSRLVRLAVASSLVLAVGALLVLALRAGGPREAEDGPRIPVAVADVENGTSDPELSGLSGMLVTSLEQSRRLTVLTRSRLVDAIRQLGREPPAVLDEPLAREVGKSLGVRALLLATVHRFDDVYAIELRALDPVRNEYLFTLSEQGRGKSRVPDLIDRLSRRTRERLSERAADVEVSGRPVANLTTSSLAAYEQFFKARQAIDLRQFDRAQEELQSALRLDPGFALALYQVTVLDAWTHVLGLTGFDAPEAREQKANLEAALRVADRLPYKERISLLAWKATVDQRTDEAIRLRDQVAEAFPQDKEAVFWAADVRFHAGDATGAVPGFEKALELDPDYLLCMEHLVQALDQSGQRTQQLVWARRWAEAARTTESRRSLARALLASGRGEEAEQVFRSAWTGLPWPPPALAAWWARHGQVQEAERQLRLALAAAVPSYGPHPTQEQQFFALLRRNQRETLVNVLALQGRWREAAQAVRDGEGDRTAEERAVGRLGLALGTRSLPLARQAVAEIGEPALSRSTALCVQAALALAVAGDAAAAEPLLARARRQPGWAALPPAGRDVIEGVMALRQGRLDDAEQRLRAAAGQPMPEPRFQGLVVLAELEWSRGRAAEALAAAEQALAETWSQAGSWFWLNPRTLLLAAQASERLGDLPRSRRHLDAFLALWRRADPELPQLAQARDLDRRLQARR